VTVAEVCRECERLRVELGLLQAAGDALAEANPPCVECKHYWCEATRRWNSLRQIKGDTR